MQENMPSRASNFSIMTVAQQSHVAPFIHAAHKQYADFYKTIVAGEGFYVSVKENKTREKLLEIYGLVLISGGAPSKQHAEQIALIEKEVSRSITSKTNRPSLLVCSGGRWYVRH
jgi:hypothetical protein